MPGVLAGIDGWVRRGGRLIFIADARDAETAGRDPTAAGWLLEPLGRPGKVERLVPLRARRPSKSTAVPGRPALDRAALAGLQVPLLADAAKLDGAIVAYEGNSPADLPLVVRSAVSAPSRGSASTSTRSVRSWQGTDSLLVELLGRWIETSESGRAGATPGTARSRRAVEQGDRHYPASTPYRSEIIAALGILYVACLYPLDWWLASRGGGRAWLARLTLPLMVTVFSSTARGTADRWKGTHWQASAADVTDIDATDGFMRGISYLGVWSPDNAAVDLSAPAASVGCVRISPISGVVRQAAPIENGCTERASVARRRRYSYGAALDSLDNVPIAASSSRLFEADWTATWTATNAQRRSPRASIAMHKARCVAAREPARALDDCVTVHAGWLYDVGSLKPGGRFDPQSGPRPRSLAMTATRYAGESATCRWDVETRDVARIWRSPASTRPPAAALHVARRAVSDASISRRCSTSIVRCWSAEVPPAPTGDNPPAATAALRRLPQPPRPCGG